MLPFHPTLEVKFPNNSLLHPDTVLHVVVIHVMQTVLTVQKSTVAISQYDKCNASEICKVLLCYDHWYFAR